MSQVRLLDENDNPLTNLSGLRYRIYNTDVLSNIPTSDLLASGNDGTTDSQGYFTLPSFNPSQDAVILILSDADGVQSNSYRGFAGPVYRGDDNTII